MVHCGMCHPGMCCWMYPIYVTKCYYFVLVETGKVYVWLPPVLSNMGWERYGQVWDILKDSSKKERSEKMTCEQKQSFSPGKKSLSYDSSHPIGEGTISLLSCLSLHKSKTNGFKFCSKGNARWILERVSWLLRVESAMGRTGKLWRFWRTS